MIQLLIRKLKEIIEYDNFKQRNVDVKPFLKWLKGSKGFMMLCFSTRTFFSQDVVVRLSSFVILNTHCPGTNLSSTSADNESLSSCDSKIPVLHVSSAILSLVSSWTSAASTAATGAILESFLLAPSFAFLQFLT